MSFVTLATFRHCILDLFRPGVFLCIPQCKQIHLSLCQAHECSDPFASFGCLGLAFLGLKSWQIFGSSAPLICSHTSIRCLKHSLCVATYCLPLSPVQSSASLARSSALSFPSQWCPNILSFAWACVRWAAIFSTLAISPKPDSLHIPAYLDL